jgi:hypothetical protein
MGEIEIGSDAMGQTRHRAFIIDRRSPKYASMLEKTRCCWFEPSGKEVVLERTRSRRGCFYDDEPPSFTKNFTNFAAMA